MTLPQARAFRDEGQQQSLWDVSENTRDDFLRIVESVPPGQLFTVNAIRDLLDLAMIPDKARGGLMSAAVKAGLCRPEKTHVPGHGEVTITVQSTGLSAHAASVRLYRRTPEKG